MSPAAKTIASSAPTSLGHLAPAPPQPRLAEGEIHLYAILLDRGPTEVAEIGTVLCDEERARAARFRFSVHRDRFIAGRGAMRRILAAYCGCAPADLDFRYGERGKPELAARPDLFFNLSHSHDLGLLGVTRAGRLGVDVERMRSSDDLGKIARRFFSSPEVECLEQLPHPLRTAGFFNAWTRKEAYLKAVGVGLALPLDRFDVSLAPEEPARFLAFRDPREDLSRWSLWALSPAPGFAAAAALEGHARLPEIWRWP